MVADSAAKILEVERRGVDHLEVDLEGTISEVEQVRQVRQVVVHLVTI